MKRAGLTAGLILLLAACGSTPSPPPPVIVAVPAPPPPPAPVKLDQCGAGELQGLVGRPRSEIPVPVDPGRQRVACTTCAVTMDYSPGRLNFFFDADTGLIKEIRCG